MFIKWTFHFVPLAQKTLSSLSYFLALPMMDLKKTAQRLHALFSSSSCTNKKGVQARKAEESLDKQKKDSSICVHMFLDIRKVSFFVHICLLSKEKKVYAKKLPKHHELALRAPNHLNNDCSLIQTCNKTPVFCNLELILSCRNACYP